MSDSTAPWFYQIFAGISREACVETLGPRAFELTSEQIVGRLAALGYKPDVLDPSREPLPAPGVTARLIDEAGRVFLVSVDETEGMIAVQERVGQPYPDE